MVVEGVLKLLGESLHGETLGQQLLVQVDDLLAEFVNLLGLGLDNAELALEVGNRVVEDFDVL
jgi:hypothetical protein